MKALTTLLALFLSFNSLAQTDSLQYRWKNSGYTPGFYSSFAKLKENKPLHTGPFTVAHGMGNCRFNLECDMADIKVTSKVKGQVFPLDIKYVYDGTELFVVYKTTPGGFGRHIEVNTIQNAGRYCFFERIITSTQNGVKPSARHLIIDLQTNTIMKPSKKNMAALSKDHKDLLEKYKKDEDRRKLLKYLILLNERLGY